MTEMSTPLSRRLIRALREAGADLPGDDGLYFIRRLYPSRGWRSGGAWVWSLDYPAWIGDSQRIRAVAQNVGSLWTVTHLMKTGVVITPQGIGYIVDPKGKLTTQS